jgi:hypothetical protein
MNNAQIAAIWIAVVVLVLMGLVPPWTFVVHYASSDFSTHNEKPAGYSFIMTPPAPEKAAPIYGVKLDAARLSVQSTVAAVVGVAAVWTLKSRRK